MAFISDEALRGIQERHSRLMDRIRRTKEEAKEKAEEMYEHGAVAGGAFLAGMVKGKMSNAEGKWVIGETDFEWTTLAGLLGIGLSMTGLAGDWGKIIGRAGDGALAFDIGTYGFNLGRRSEEGGVVDGIGIGGGGEPEILGPVESHSPTSMTIAGDTVGAWPRMRSAKRMKRRSIAGDEHGVEEMVGQPIDELSDEDLAQRLAEQF